MLSDLDAQMRRVASFVGIDVNESRWPALVERCTFAEMKDHAEELADFDATFVGGADTFLYRGSNTRWRDILTADELSAFDERSRELLTTEADAWARAGQSVVQVAGHAPH
jgi:aryl sulfotransferase